MYHSHDKLRRLFGTYVTSWLLVGDHSFVQTGQLDQDRHMAELMRAAQEGDTAAYGQLLRDLLPILRSITHRQGTRTERVEEVVQDVLRTIHRVRHTYDPARPLLPWVSAIARRRAVDLRTYSTRMSNSA